MDKNDSLWKLSLIIIFTVTVICIVCKSIGIKLPDVAIVIMGIVDFFTLPVLVYTSVKKRKLNN